MGVHINEVSRHFWIQSSRFSKVSFYTVPNVNKIKIVPRLHFVLSLMCESENSAKIIEPNVALIFNSTLFWVRINAGEVIIIVEVIPNTKTYAIFPESAKIWQNPVCESNFKIYGQIGAEL